MMRGFTLIEFAIVMAVGAILVPAAWATVRTIEATHHEALAKTSAARQMRTLSDALRADLLTLRPAAQGLVLEGEGACSKVSYVLVDDVVHRRGEGECGPARAVASGVSTLDRAPSGVRVVFARRTGRASPTETAFELAWSTGVAP